MIESKDCRDVSANDRLFPFVDPVFEPRVGLFTRIVKGGRRLATIPSGAVQIEVESSNYHAPTIQYPESSERRTKMLRFNLR